MTFYEHYELVYTQFHFQTQQIELRKIIEQALGKPSPPYQPTPRRSELVEDRLCENTNK